MQYCNCKIKMPAAPLSDSPMVYCLLCGWTIPGAALATELEKESKREETARLTRAYKLFDQYEQGMKQLLKREESEMAQIIRDLYAIGYVLRPLPGESYPNCGWRLIEKSTMLPASRPGSEE